MNLKHWAQCWVLDASCLSRFTKRAMAVLKSLNKLVLIGIIGYIAVNCSRSPNTPREESILPGLPFASELQDAINQALPSGQDQPELGISAAVIVPGYRTWTGVSGKSHASVPITADMLFDTGSIEKNFQAALILKLAEEKRLSLEDPISKYLPAYKNVDGKITIRQLLNHTSGVFNVFEHPDFPWVGREVDYSRSWEIEQVFNNFVLEPYSPPGYAQHYASTNYLLLTSIVEKVTGNSVPDELERRFLSPMQLEHTFISMGTHPPEKFFVAHPWVDVDGDGLLEDLYGIPLTWKVTLTHPVLFSTPGDLARWMDAVYHDRAVLSPEALNEMLTYPETILRDPESARYGLGVVDYSDLLDMPVYGHGGSSLGYCGAALYMPEQDISLAWLVNTGESPPELASQIMMDAWSSLSDVLITNAEALP
jgi:D-alanyl-D-alanine carboxypeptidase